MAFLRPALPEDYLEPLYGPGIILRPPTGPDYAEWAELRSLSRTFLTPWEPQWSRDELTRMTFRRRLKAYGQDARDDLGYAFFIVEAQAGKLVGGVNLSNVRRGVSQAASLGYWIGAPHAGQGHMTRAVTTLLPFAFRVLRLHRIEAASMPTNSASQRVLEKACFTCEGLARRFLKINGNWEDHVIYSRLEDEHASSSGVVGS